MAQYIDKTKIEEILRSLWKKDDGNNSEHRICYNKALQEVQCQIDTLDVKEIDLKKSVKGRIDYPLIGADFPNIYPNYKELKEYCDKNGIKDEDEVKIIIIKDE